MNIHSQKYMHSARTVYVRIIVMCIVCVCVCVCVYCRFKFETVHEYVHTYTLCIYILKKTRTLSAPNAHSVCIYNRYVFSIFYAHSVCMYNRYVYSRCVCNSTH